MDNQPHDVMPPVELPRPVEDKPPAPQESPIGWSGNESDASRALEQGSPASAVPPHAQTPVVPLPLQPASLQADDALSVPVSATPAIADDTDLIEKEWVEKAKEIVQRTKADPYVQSKELNRMKADYLKKRYNKDLKVSEE